MEIRETKIFAKKKIIIRMLSAKDLKMVRQWRKYVNDLIDENTYLTTFKKMSAKEEKVWLEEGLRKIKKQQAVLLVALDDDRIVGTSRIDLLQGKQSHIGQFGIALSKGYRGFGLGHYLAEKIVELAKEKFKTNLKFIELGVFAENKIAFSLYRKVGFVEVSRIPNRFQQNGKIMDEIIMHCKNR